MSYPYKAVVFDWAWTLVDLGDEDDRRPFLRMFDFLREKQVELPDFDDCFQVYRDLFYKLIKNSRETHREACFEQVLNYLLLRYSIDINGKTSVRELLTQYYKEVYSCRKVYPDVIHTLDGLQALGVRLGVISNTTNPGFMKDYEREQLGLDRYFEFSVYSSEVPYRKPHRSIFELAIKRLGVDVKQILYVGDHLEIDVGGAQGVGMPVAWINRRDMELAGGLYPEHEIQSLTDLLQIDSIRV